MREEKAEEGSALWPASRLIHAPACERISLCRLAAGFTSRLRRRLKLELRFELAELAPFATLAHPLLARSFHIALCSHIFCVEGCLAAVCSQPVIEPAEECSSRVANYQALLVQKWPSSRLKIFGAWELLD